MKINPIVPGGRPLLALGYKYNFKKVLGCIATEGAGSTAPGDSYLSRFPNIYYNVDVRPVFHPQLLGRYVNACNAIDNHNMMRKSDLSLEKYWVTQSGYFRLTTKFALGMGISYEKLLYWHGVSEVNVDRRISTLYYNSTIYDCFYNPFIDDFGIPDLNLPPITFGDRPRPHKISCYTPDLLLAAIYFATGISFSTLTTPSDFPDLLPSVDPNTLHVMNMYARVLGRVHRVYFCRKHNQKGCYKKTRIYCFDMI